MCLNFIFLWRKIVGTNSIRALCWGCTVKTVPTIVITCALIVLYPSLAPGGVGTEVFEFLRLPNGARQAALSGCSIGMVGDPFAIFSNPAGLQTDTRTLGFTYTRYVDEIQGGCGTYVLPAFGGTFGAGISYLNFAKIAKTDENGQDLGYFTPQSFVPIVGYSRRLGDARIGLSSKIIYQSIDEYTGLAVAGDIGYLFYPKKWQSLVIGGTVQNLGMNLKRFNETYEPLPIFARLGGSYLLFNKLVQLSAEMELPAKEVIFGVEWRPSKILAIRGGYYSWGKDLKVGSDMDIFAGKSFGIGLKTQKFHLDYALTPMVDLGIVHRISLIRSFPEISKKAEEKPVELKELEEEPEQEVPEEEVPEETPEEKPESE